MLKRFLCSTFAFCICCCAIILPANAAATSISVCPETNPQRNDNVVVLNDPELLQMFESTGALLSTDPDPEPGPNPHQPEITLTNRVLVGERYYGDQPFIVDSLQGPLVKPSFELVTSSTCGWNADVSISKSLISATFGVNFSKEYSLKRTITFGDVAAGETLIYRAYVNYCVYQYDILTDGVKTGTGRYWTPVGIVVTQSRM